VILPSSKQLTHCVVARQRYDRTLVERWSRSSRTSQSGDAWHSSTITGERVRLFTRNGNDWSERFPAVVKAMELLEVKSCLIDGVLFGWGPDADRPRLEISPVEGVKVRRLIYILRPPLELSGGDAVLRRLRAMVSEIGRWHHDRAHSTRQAAMMLHAAPKA